MHLLFPSMDLLEMWIEKFEEIIPPEQPQMDGGAASCADAGCGILGLVVVVIILVVLGIV